MFRVLLLAVLAASVGAGIGYLIDNWARLRTRAVDWVMGDRDES